VSGDSDSAWLWWLGLALLIAGIGLVGWLVAAVRRRRQWQTNFEAAQAESGWLSQELLPGLTASGSVDQVAGGWAVSRSRVVDLEDQLTALDASAATQDQGKALPLREAVRSARVTVDGIAEGVSEGEMWALEIDEAIATLETARQVLP
jgi:hypothetical protein